LPGDDGAPAGDPRPGRVAPAVGRRGGRVGVAAGEALVGREAACHMSPASEGHPLSLLPVRVRGYRDALAADDLVAAERCRIGLCSVVESLLENHLRGCDGADRISMVDGVLPATLDVSDPGVVSLAGVAVWTGARARHAAMQRATLVVSSVT